MRSSRRLLTVLCLSLPLSLAACQTPAGEDEDLEATESLPQGLFTRPPVIDHASETVLNADEGLRGFDPAWGEHRWSRLLTHYTQAGQFKLLMREDTCSLVLTQTIVDGRGFESTKQLWTSFSTSSLWRLGLPRNCYAWFQTDGNFVIYGEVGEQPWGEAARYSAIWSTNTWRHPGARLVLEENGNVAIYAANGTAVWQTKTAQRPLPDAPAGPRPPGGHPGCRFARTESKCGFPPSFPIGSMICRDVYVCSNDVNPREEADPWRICGTCVGGKL